MTLKKPKISVIIPVYEVERYLRRCLDSVIAQTFTDWEAICVDDGSMDDSGKILDEYAARDKRFRVIHKENAGVSAARNDGIKLARGEFVHFMDSDDFIDPDYYEKMIDALVRAGADAAVSGFVTNVKYTKGLRYRRTRVVRNTFKIFKRTNALSDGYVWRYVFSKKFLSDCGISFPVGMLTMEDMNFLLQILVRMRVLVVVPDVLYHYMFNDLSLLNTRDAEKRKKMKLDYKASKEFRRAFAREHGLMWLWRMRKLQKLPYVGKFFRG